MWYWNKANFEGLKAVADSIADKEQWRLFADYCRLREQGLRKPALACIDRLLEQVPGWSPAERREFAMWLCELTFADLDAHSLICAPLHRNFLVPTLQDWANEEPNNAAAQRSLGLATCDADCLSNALGLDPTDDITRYHLVRRELDAANYACHELPGALVCDPMETLESLDRSMVLAADFRDAEIKRRVTEQIKYLLSAVRDWMQFERDEGTNFAEWCHAHHRNYPWQ